MKLSPELKRELTRWLSDATSENPSEKAKTSGLCGYIDFDVRGQLQWLLSEYLVKGIHKSMYFPFGGSSIYFRERVMQTSHLNEDRLAFVRSVLDAKD